MLKKIALVVLLFISLGSTAQKNFETTNQFVVMGLVETPLTITYSDLEKEKIIDIGSLKITNHLGELKREYKNLKGVLLIDVLRKLSISTPSPRLLSECYFILRATDGYSAVISWNELFNSEMGNSFYLIVEADGVSQKESIEKMLLVATKDYRTGRRHIKGLTSIEVKRI